MQNPPIQKVEISVRTIVFTVFFILLLVLLWMMRDLLLSLFLAFIIMSAAKPLVAWLHKLGIPRQLAIAGVFLVAVGLFAAGSFWIFPPLIYETGLLVKHLPAMIKTLTPAIDDVFNVSSLFQYAPNITSQVFEVIKTFFSNATFFVTTIFFSVYLTADEKFLKNLLVHVLNEKDTARVVAIIEQTEKRLGAWLLGELLLMLTIGIMTFIGLTLLGVRYALSLSILAGLLEIVPNFGPIISTVPAFIVAVAQSYFLGLASIALYFVVHQSENHLIVPFIMKKVIGLSPVITLIALIVGGRLFGVLGILLSIPFTLFLETLLQEILYVNKKKGSF